MYMHWIHSSVDTSAAYVHGNITFTSIVVYMYVCTWPNLASVPRLVPKSPERERRRERERLVSRSQ